MKHGLRAILSASLLVIIPVLARADFGQAVEAPFLAWTTGGDSSWFESTISPYSYDNSARSGTLGDSSQNYLSTIVTGPGVMTFFWRVSSEQGWDKLKFKMDEVMIREISGEIWWHHMAIPIPDGAHTLKWEYSKDGSTSKGYDSGWVDQVVWVPGGATTAAAAVSKPAMPTPRSQCGGTNSGGLIYVLGGWNGVYLTANEEFDPTAGNWFTRASSGTSRAQLAVVSHGGYVYAIGGFSGSYMGTNQRYYPTGNSWLGRVAMTWPRRNLAAAVATGSAGDRIFAIGGDDATKRPTNEAYNPTVDVWSTMAQMPTARDGLAAAAVNNRIYAIGGQDGSNVTLGVVEEYNPETDSWIPKANMLTPRRNFGAAALNGRIYAVGGVDAGGANVSVIEEYNPLTDSWAAVGNLAIPRQELAVAAVNGRIYAIGGKNSTGQYAGDVEEITIGITGGGGSTALNNAKAGALKLGKGEIIVAPNVMNRKMPVPVSVVMKGDPGGKVEVRIYNEVGAYMGNLLDVQLDSNGYGEAVWYGQVLERYLGPGMYWMYAEGGGVSDRRPFLVKMEGK